MSKSSSTKTLVSTNRVKARFVPPLFCCSMIRMSRSSPPTWHLEATEKTNRRIRTNQPPTYRQGSLDHGENGGGPLGWINPIYILYSGYLLGISVYPHFPYDYIINPKNAIFLGANHRTCRRCSSWCRGLWTCLRVCFLGSGFNRYPPRSFCLTSGNIPLKPWMLGRRSFPFLLGFR